MIKTLTKSTRSDSCLYFKNLKTGLKCKRSTRVQTQAGCGLFSSKRSQHEAMGFVIIVALVIIVGVIFLGIRMNQDSTPQEYKDSNILNFLTASSKYSSDCFENHEPLTLDDLKERCYKDEKCDMNGVDTLSCELLKETYSDMLAKSWQIYDDSPVKYYELKIYYRATCNDSTTAGQLTSQEFIIEAGNLSQCYSSGRKIGQESFPISGSGEECIVSELEICEKETK